MDRKIIAVDFDGTLAVTNYPTIIKPINSVIEYIKRRKANGDIIILNTCRHDKPLEEAVEWCKEQGIEFDYINENVPELIEKYGDCRKIFADIYLENNALNLEELQFNYDFENLLYN